MKCPNCMTDISDCENREYVFNLEEYQIEGPYCIDCCETREEMEPEIYIESPDPIEMKMKQILKRYGEKMRYEKIREYTAEEIEKLAKLIIKLKQPKETMRLAGKIMAFCHIAEANHYWDEKIWSGYNRIFEKKQWELGNEMPKL